MADFFSKVKKGFNKGTSTISIKSSTLMETNKLKGEISSLKREKTEVFTTVGEKLYNMKKEGSIVLEELEGAVERAFEIEVTIGEKEKAIEETLKKQEEALRALGEEAPTPEAAPSTERICSCGASVGPETKFCAKCGQKVEDEIVEEPVAEEAIEAEAEEVEEVAEAEAAPIVCDCGAVVPPDTVFCAQCGKKLS